MILWLTFLIPIIFIVCGIVYRRCSGRCTCKTRLDGSTVIITGASAGIGEATALDLAGRGAKIIMACRNLGKAQKVADKIIASTGNPQVIVEIVDMSDLDSVRRFAQRLKKSEKSVQILINNAGLGIQSIQLSPQNLELTMATNYYGHFLLTNLLLDLLKNGTPSRIIHVSSVLHSRVQELNFDDLNFRDKQYTLLKAYSQSKLCNILFSNELSRRLDKTGITSNSLHPGLVATEGFQKAGTLRGLFYQYLSYILGKDCMTGAQTVIHLAVSEDLKEVSGKYFVDCKEVNCSKLAEDTGFSKKLWEVTGEHVQLQHHEKCY